MKKIISYLMIAAMLILCVVSFASCGDKTPTLYVYTNAGFAPYEYLDGNGNVVGVDIDVMNYIGEKLGYKVIVNDIDFNNILTEVAKNEFAVGAAGMSKKASRDEVALASDVYATSIQYVIAPKGTFTTEIVKIADVVTYVAGLTKTNAIGSQKGTTGCDMVSSAIGEAETTEAVAAGKVKNIEYSNAIIASQDIGTTVAAVVIDKMPAESICSGNSELQCWQLDGEMESYVLYFNKNATELVAKVNELLAQMKQEGTIDTFTVKHSSGN